LILYIIIPNVGRGKGCSTSPTGACLWTVLSSTLPIERFVFLGGMKKSASSGFQERRSTIRSLKPSSRPCAAATFPPASEHHFNTHRRTFLINSACRKTSRLMGENEAETVRTLTSYRKIMAELIQQHRGRVIDSTGDNMLVEFGSVVDAVICGVEVQA